MKRTPDAQVSISAAHGGESLILASNLRLAVVNNTREAAGTVVMGAQTLGGAIANGETHQMALVVSDLEMRGLQVRQDLQLHGCDCPRENVVPLNEAMQRLIETNPDLVIVLLSPAPDLALRVLTELRTLTASRVLAIGPAHDPLLILRTLRSGADEYLDELKTDAELDVTVANRKSGQMQRLCLGSAVMVLSPSGGAGASTVAVNLAAVLASEAKPALLVDLHAQTGDLAALLDVKPTFSIQELCSKSSQIERALFQRTLTPHASGIRLLASPRRFAEETGLTGDQTRQIINLGRSTFANVVFDLDRTYAPEQIQALRLADAIVLVLRLDFCCLKNTRQCLELLLRNGIPAQRICLVANRTGQPKEIDLAQAQEALGLPIVHTLPDDPRTVNRANNNGIPLVLESPTSKVARGILQIAEYLEKTAKKPRASSASDGLRPSSH